MNNIFLKIDNSDTLVKIMHILVYIDTHVLITWIHVVTMVTYEERKQSYEENYGKEYYFSLSHFVPPRFDTQKASQVAQ